MSDYPRIAPMGLSGLLIQFGDTLSEQVSRAVLAFRAKLEVESWPGIEETTTSLTSVFLRFDPIAVTHETMLAQLRGLLAGADWYAADLPGPQRHWVIPAVLGGDGGPQLAEAAALAGVDEGQAHADIEAAEVTVLTIGFAPGQPYMGNLPPHWDIPRQTGLTARVPAGALVVAIRQLIIFTAPNPTGWRHIGQTAFECFRPDADDPFALRNGDKVRFKPVTEGEMQAIRARDTSGNGGATLRVGP